MMLTFLFEKLQTANQCARAPTTSFKNFGHIEAEMLQVDSGSGKHFWENAGTIKTGQLQLSGNHLSITNTPTGTLQTNAFTSTAQMLNNFGDVQVKGTMSITEFTNLQGGKLKVDNFILHKNGKLTNTLNSIVMLREGLTADSGVILNDGTLTTVGKFVQQSGELINTGVWDHKRRC